MTATADRELIRLVDRDGHGICHAVIPLLDPVPQVVLWGPRLFARDRPDDLTYREVSGLTLQPSQIMVTMPTKIRCQKFTPDHNGECVLCDEWMDAHDADAIAAGERGAGIHVTDAALRDVLQRLEQGATVDALRREWPTLSEEHLDIALAIFHRTKQDPRRPHP